VEREVLRAGRVRRGEKNSRRGRVTCEEEKKKSFSPPRKTKRQERGRKKMPSTTLHIGNLLNFRGKTGIFLPAMGGGERASTRRNNPMHNKGCARLTHPPRGETLKGKALSIRQQGAFAL